MSDPIFIGFPMTIALKGEGRGRAVQCYDFGFQDSHERLHWTLRADITDANSIPWYLEWLAGNPWENPWASFIHDGDYAWQAWTRKICDKAFPEGLRVCDAPRWKQERFYRAVRLGGKSAYDDFDLNDMNRFDLIPKAVLNDPSDRFIPDQYKSELAQYRRRCAIKWAEEVTKLPHEKQQELLEKNSWERR